MTPRFAIRVTWCDGEDEYLMQGDRVAMFANRTRAEAQVEFMKMGMDDNDCQAITVVPYPHPSERGRATA